MVRIIKNLSNDEYASDGECIAVDNIDPNCTTRDKSVRKGRSSKRKKDRKNKEPPQSKITHPSLETIDSDVLQETADKMIRKFAVDDKVRFEGDLDKYGDVT
jgi:hypothetical protein